VQTEVNESGRFERILTVRIDNSELAEAKERAARKISKGMKIRGFRPGKAPLAVVERMAGADFVRSEAIEDAIQSVVPAAIDEAGLEPVTVPSVSAIRDQNDDGTVEIDQLDQILALGQIGVGCRDERAVDRLLLFVDRRSPGVIELLQDQRDGLLVAGQADAVVVELVVESRLRAGQHDTVIGDRHCRPRYCRQVAHGPEKGPSAAATGTRQSQLSGPRTAMPCERASDESSSTQPGRVRPASSMDVKRSFSLSQS